VYVDGIIISRTDDEINNTFKFLKKEYNIKTIGDIDYIIGIKLIKHKEGFVMHQKGYIEDFLK